jgi:hypothetical protein
MDACCATVTYFFLIRRARDRVAWTCVGRALFLRNLAHIITFGRLNQQTSTMAQALPLSTMPTKKSRFCSPLQPPSLSMSELICKTLDHDATDVLIDKRLEYRKNVYLPCARSRTLGVGLASTWRSAACLEQGQFCFRGHLHAYRRHRWVHTPRLYLDHACVPSIARHRTVTERTALHLPFTALKNANSRKESKDY